MRKRVLSFVRRDVVDALRNDGQYRGDLRVCIHPALRFDTMGNRQFCDVLELFSNVLSIPDFSGYYLLELSVLNVQRTENNYLGRLGKLSKKEVIAIYLCTKTDSGLYQLSVIYKSHSGKALLPMGAMFTRDSYNNDKLPVVDMTCLPEPSYWYCYEAVRDAYISTILQAYGATDKFAYVVEKLTKDELTLDQLYEKVCQLVKPTSFPNQCADDFVRDNLAVDSSADKSVLEFIADFRKSRVRTMSPTETADCLESLFKEDYSYYFAIMLRAAFMRGNVCMTDRIVWVDDNNVIYDISGVVVTDEKPVLIENVAQPIIARYIRTKGVF